MDTSSTISMKIFLITAIVLAAVAAVIGLIFTFVTVAKAAVVLTVLILLGKLLKLKPNIEGTVGLIAVGTVLWTMAIPWLFGLASWLFWIFLAGGILCLAYLWSRAGSEAA